MAPEVLKKLENYESGRSHLLERIEELSQAIARLTAENRSTREWFMSRLQLLWENNTQRDGTTGEALESILEHAEEMSRHIGLREFGEKLAAFLKDPPDADVDPRQTLLPFATRPPPITPRPTASTAGDKRPAEVDEHEGHKTLKRRKLAGP